MPRGWSAARRTSNSAPCEVRASFGEGRCAPRRSMRCLPAAGPRFRQRVSPTPSASFWRGVLLPPGGAPTPPEREGCVFLRPRAPTADAGSTRYRPNQGCPIVVTPREDALSRTRHVEYTPNIGLMSRYKGRCPGGRALRYASGFFAGCGAGSLTLSEAASGFASGFVSSAPPSPGCASQPCSLA